MSLQNHCDVGQSQQCSAHLCHRQQTLMQHTHRAYCPVTLFVTRRWNLPAPAPSRDRQCPRACSHQPPEVSWGACEDPGECTPVFAAPPPGGPRSSLTTCTPQLGPARVHSRADRPAFAVHSGLAWVIPVRTSKAGAGGATFPAPRTRGEGGRRPAQRCCESAQRLLCSQTCTKD